MLLPDDLFPCTQLGISSTVGNHGLLASPLPICEVSVNDLLQRCEAELPELMKLWEQVVNVDSGSGHVPGLRKVAEILEQKLMESSFAVTRRPVNGPDGEFNLVGQRQGKGKASILFMAHMDTVFGPGTAAERPFTVDGEWAHGPGVSDCKAGIVTVVHGLKLLKDFDGFKTITVLFNCDEEIGSPDSKDLIVELAKQHDYVLSFEPGSEADGVTTARKGNAKLHLQTFGKNSHAGSDPDKGRNALMELVWQIDQLADLGDPDKKTTVTFTKASCGDRINVVPDKAEAWADVRVFYPEELDRLDKDIAAASATRRINDCRVDAKLVRSRPPFPPSPGTDKLAALAAKIYGEIGRPLKSGPAGGASDVNYAVLGGAIALDSMGPAKGGPNHCPEEKAHIPTVAPRMYLLVRMVKELCAAG